MDPPDFLQPGDIMFVLPEGKDLLEGPTNASITPFYSELGISRKDSAIAKDEVITFILTRVFESGVYNFEISAQNSQETADVKEVIEERSLSSLLKREGSVDLPIYDEEFREELGDIMFASRLEHRYDEAINEALMKAFAQNIRDSRQRPEVSPVAFDRLRRWAHNIAVIFDAADPTGRKTIRWESFVTHLMGLINSQESEAHRRLLIEFSQETRGGLVDDEEMSNLIRAQLKGEGNKVGEDDKFTISDSAGAPLVLADRTSSDDIARMSVEYIHPFSLWSVLQVNAAVSRGQQSSRNSKWFLLEESGLKTTIVTAHVFEDHGVCICFFVEPLLEFIVFSRRQTISTFVYKNAYAPAVTAGGQLQERRYVEPKRTAAHFPYDVTAVSFCKSTGLLLVGTFDGSIIGVPVLEEDEKGWSAPLFVISKCTEETITCLAPLPKQRKIICGSFAPRIKIADTTRLAANQALSVPAHHGGIRHILIAEDLHMMVTCGHGQEIALWALSFPTEVGSGVAESTHRQQSQTRSFLVGELKDTNAPHVPPLVEIWRGGAHHSSTPSSSNSKIRNKLFSVDSVGTVKIWDIPSRMCVSSCSQPSVFRTLAAGFATRSHKGTSFGKIASGVRRAHQIRANYLSRLRGKRESSVSFSSSTAETFEAIKVRLCGVDVTNHRVETREIVVSLGDDYAESVEKSKAATYDPLNPFAQNNAPKPVLSESARRGKHLVLTGHSLLNRTRGGNFTKPFHIGTFDVEPIGSIVSITNNFIIVLERYTHRLISRYSGFEAPFTAACVSTSRHVWRFSRLAFVAMEGQSAVLGISLGTGETTLCLHMYETYRHGNQNAGRDIVAIVLANQRNLVIAANGEGCIAVFKLPVDDSQKTLEPIRPAHFVRCTTSFITRMAFHASAEILAVGDGTGRITQWEVTQTTFSLCSRIAQNTNPLGGSGSEKGHSLKIILSNRDTDALLHSMALDETSIEVTAIASLDPLRAFAVGTSDGKVAVWTTVPFDRAISVFSWNYHLPRSLTEAQKLKPVVTAFHVDNTSRMFVVRMVDDQGSWSSWSLGLALKESKLLDYTNTSLQDASAKWSTSELFGNVRPPTVISCRQLTLSRDLPLVCVEVVLGERAEILSLVSVSNGDALLVNAVGEITSVIQPTVRRDKQSHRTASDDFFSAQKGKNLYDCDDALSVHTQAAASAVQPADGKKRSKWSIVKEQCARDEADVILRALRVRVAAKESNRHAFVDPSLPRPTLAPPSSPTDFVPLKTHLRVSSASGKIKANTGSNVLSIVQRNKLRATRELTMVRRPVPDEAAFVPKLECIAELSTEERARQREAPLLYPANMTLALSSPMAFTFHGGGASVEDALQETMALLSIGEPSENKAAENGNESLTFIVNVLKSALSIAQERPLLLKDGDFVLYNLTEPLPDLSMADKVPATLNELADLSKASDERSNSVILDAGTERLESMVGKEEAVSESQGAIPDSLGELKPKQSPKRTDDSRFGAATPILPTRTLSELILNSSVAYPLTPSPYLSGNPPALSPQHFGAPRNFSQAVQRPSETQTLAENRDGRGIGARHRLSSPITRNSRPSTPSIPFGASKALAYLNTTPAKADTLQLKPRPKTGGGNIALRRSATPLSAAHDLARIEINHHLAGAQKRSDKSQLNAKREVEGQGFGKRDAM